MHKFCGTSRLDLELKRWFSVPEESREWFLLPLLVIEEAIQTVSGGLGEFSVSI